MIFIEGAYVYFYSYFWLVNNGLQQVLILLSPTGLVVDNTVEGVLSALQTASTRYYGFLYTHKNYFY